MEETGSSEETVDLGSPLCDSFLSSEERSRAFGIIKYVGQAGTCWHYQGKDEAALIDFIERVVLAGEDPMRPQRKQFYQENLIPPMGPSVTQATVEIIMKGLKKFE